MADTPSNRDGTTSSGPQNKLDLAAHDVTTVGSYQLVEQRLGILQIGRVEAFGKAVVDRLKQCFRLNETTLIGQQPREAAGRTQFPGQRALPARPVKRSLEMVFRGSRRCRPIL